MKLRTDPTALALARFARGMTQEELAFRAGVSVGAIERAETGAPPTIRTALKLAEALDTEAGALFLAASRSSGHEEARVAP